MLLGAHWVLCILYILFVQATKNDVYRVSCFSSDCFLKVWTGHFTCHISCMCKLLKMMCLLVCFPVRTLKVNCCPCPLWCHVFKGIFSIFAIITGVVWLYHQVNSSLGVCNSICSTCQQFHCWIGILGH